MEENFKREKLKKSYKYLTNALYLLDHVKNSTPYVADETNQKKLLCYLSRVNEVMCRFTNVFFGYKHAIVINKYCPNVTEELKKACDANMDLIRLTKIHLHALLAKDMKAQDIISAVFEKIQLKFQRYLVHIDYFNKEMFNKCQV